MFGFLSPASQSNEYRTVYSRCCQHQRYQHSLRSLPFLSYEGVFLYHYWLDATGADTSALTNQRCCKLRSLDNPEESFDLEIGRFCSALSMLLASTKIEDDVRDGISLKMRLARAVVGKQAREGREYFLSLDANFGEKIDNTYSHTSKWNVPIRRWPSKTTRNQQPLLSAMFLACYSFCQV